MDYHRLKRLWLQSNSKENNLKTPQNKRRPPISFIMACLKAIPFCTPRIKDIVFWTSHRKLGRMSEREVIEPMRRLPRSSASAFSIRYTMRRATHLDTRTLKNIETKH